MGEQQAVPVRLPPRDREREEDEREPDAVDRDRDPGDPAVLALGDLDAARPEALGRAGGDAAEAEKAEGTQRGVNGTPTLFVNGENVGFPAYLDLKAKIDGIIGAGG